MSQQTDELSQLSERELEVLTQVATGANNRQIAETLVLSVHTVKTHVRNIYSKLGVQSRTEAAMLAVREGWITLPGSEPDSASSEQPEPTAEPPAQPTSTPAIEPDGGPTPATTPDWLPHQPPPLAVWQQLYLVGAILLAVVVAVAPFLPAAESQQPTEIAYQTAPFFRTDINITPQPAQPTPAPPAPQHWAFHAPLRSARAYLSAVVYQNQIFAIGGIGTDNQTTGLLERYTPETNLWTVQATKPTATANTTAVVVADKIYVPGGCGGQRGVLTVLEIYDLLRDQWVTGASLPAPRCAYGLVAFAEQLYLFGGWDGQTFRDEIYRFSPTTDEWTLLDVTLPQPMGYVGVTQYEETIYLAGGYDGQAEFKETYIFSPTFTTLDEAWLTQAPMQFARSGFGFVATSNRIYAIGGGSDEPIPVSEVYNPQTNRWETLATPFDTAWRSMGVAAIGTRFYAIGGQNEVGLMDAVTSYQSIYSYFIPFSGVGTN